MADKICPLIKKECLKHGCEFYIHMVGKNPQTGKDVDVFDCSIKWLPMMLADNTSKIISVAAGVEDFRNKAVGALQAVGDVMNRRLEQLEPIDALPDPSIGPGGNNKRP